MSIPLRCLLTLLFWSAGLFGLFNLTAVTAEAAAIGLPFPTLVAIATISLQLAGSALVITDYKGLGWLGACALAAFTLLTIPFGHAFWTFEEPRRTAELHVVLEHLSLVGGLLLSARSRRSIK